MIDRGGCKIVFAIFLNKIDRIQDDQLSQWQEETAKQVSEWCEQVQKQFNFNRPITIHFVSALTGEAIDDAFNTLSTAIMQAHFDQISQDSAQNMIEDMRGSSVQLRDSYV